LTVAPAAMLAQQSAPAPANPISVSQNKMYTMLTGVVVRQGEFRCR
jgi:hypothetical protein